MGLFFQQAASAKKVSSRAKVTPEMLKKAGCRLCKLYPTCRKKELKPSGDSTDVDIYILADAPSKEALAVDSFLSPASRRYIDKAIPRDVTMRTGGIIRAYTKADKVKEYINAAHCCTSKMVEDIEKSKPLIVLAMGFGALQAALPKQSRLDAWRGLVVPAKFGEHTCWVIPTYSIDFIQHGDRQNRGYPSPYAAALEYDIKTAINLLRNWKEPVLAEASIKNECYLSYGATTSLSTIEQHLNTMLEADDVGLDIETTALKPQTVGGKEQSILSIAISTGDLSLSFPLDHPKVEDGYSEQAWALLYDFLRASNGIIAHNMKFEIMWLSFFLGDWVIDLDWKDTMANSYLLKNRKGANSLAFNTQQYLGVNVKAIMEFNAAECLAKPIEDLIEYNAYDAYYTYYLYDAQMQQLPKQQKECHEKLLQAIKALCLAELEGMHYNRRWTEAKKIEYTNKLAAIIDSLTTSLPGKQFLRQTGHVFSPGTDKDLRIFLCDIIGEQHTDSFDESHLNKMVTAYAATIVDYRKTQKILSTYLIGWSKLADDDDVIHPNFNVCFTATNRLSSSSPNAQNCPKRAHKWVRNIITSPRGYIMASLDYAQIEARVVGALSKDPVYIDALWKNYDIHMEWAVKVATKYPQRIGGIENLKDKSIMKSLRQDMKSGWTFGLLFGCGNDTVSRTLDVPRDIVDPLVIEFWRAFKRSKAWQEELQSFYKKHFYVETLGGFRRYGPIGWNDILNTPVQGTAAEIAKAGIVHITRNIQPVNCTIHDSLEFFIKEKGYEQRLEDIAEIMCTVAITDFGLNNIPWCVEAEVGEHWGELEVYKEWSSTDFGHERGKKFIPTFSLT